MSEPNSKDMPWAPNYWVAGRYNMNTTRWEAAPAYAISDIRQQLIDQLFDPQLFDAVLVLPEIYFTGVMVHNSAVIVADKLEEMMNTCEDDNE